MSSTLLRTYPAGKKGRSLWEQDAAFTGPEQYTLIKVPTVYQPPPPPCPTHTSETLWGMPIARSNSLGQSIVPLPAPQRHSIRSAPVHRNPQTTQKLAPLSHPHETIDDPTVSKSHPTDTNYQSPHVSFSSHTTIYEHGTGETTVNTDFVDPIALSTAQKQQQPTHPPNTQASPFVGTMSLASSHRRRLQACPTVLPPALPVFNPFKPIAISTDLADSRKIRKIFLELTSRQGTVSQPTGVHRSSGTMPSKSIGTAADCLPLSLLPRFIEKMGLPFDDSDLQDVLQELQHLDIDGDGHLSLDQVVQQWSSLKKTLLGKMADVIPMQMIAVINSIRADPSKYAKHLQQLQPYYTGKKFQRPKDEQPILTTEGWKAVQSAIQELQQTPPIPPLQVSLGLVRSSEIHAVDIGATGSISHTGSNQRDPRWRMEQCGQWQFSDVGNDDRIAENMSFGGRSAEDYVRIMIIDDGISTRQHRKNILDPRFNYVGAGVATHTGFGTVGVINFAHKFVDKDERSLPRRPTRCAMTMPVPSRQAAEAARKLQLWCRMHLAHKLLQAMLEDDRLTQSKMATVFQSGCRMPITKQFQQATVKLPIKFQQHVNKALKNPRTNVRITFTNHFIQVKSWGGGMDAIMTQNFRSG